MSKRDPIRLYVGDDFNPEKRAGQPRWTGGRKGVGERFLTTWFTCGNGWRWADEGELDKLKGAKAIRGNVQWVLVEYYRAVYYKDGRFYAFRTSKNAAKKGDFGQFVPVDGSIWTCKPKYQAKYGLPDAEIICMEGYPTSVRIGEDAFSVTNDSWPMVESFLGLDEMYKPEAYRPRRIA